MSKNGSRASVVLASAFGLLAAGAEAAAPRHLTGWDASAVDRARAGAVQRLQDDECRKVFADFRDANGRTLQRALEEWGASPADYIGLVPFIDGSSEKLCRKANTALVATPGVRRVFVCKAFATFQLQQPRVAESMVIHEILHTLGLEESPMVKGAPTSIEITQRVEARCR
jgi:hypothetical protein